MWPSYAAAVAVLTLLAVLAISLVRFYPVWKQFRQDCNRLLESGALAPPPTDEAYRQWICFCQWVCRCFVGKVTSVGSEKLHKLDAPFFLILNHGSLLDTAVANLVLMRKGRHPGAKGVLKLMGGLVVYLSSRSGVFCVDLDNGAPARESMVRVLCEGEIVYAFPEAWTHMDGSIHRFKTGAVRATREASLILKRTVPIVPARIIYNKYPGSWVNKLPLPLQWLLPLLFAFYYGRGATVFVGDPIDPWSLPDDAREAMELIRQKVIAMGPEP